MVSKEEKLRLTFADMAQQGDAFARHNDEVVFTPGAIPGEEAIVQLRGWKRRYLLGEVLELVKPSPHRTEAQCWGSPKTRNRRRECCASSAGRSTW